MSAMGQPSIPPGTNRFVKCDAIVAEPCKYCHGPTVRVRGLSPVHNSKHEDGVAGFTICRQCDQVSLGPPKKVVTR